MKKRVRWAATGVIMVFVAFAWSSWRHVAERRRELKQRQVVAWVLHHPERIDAFRITNEFMPDYERHRATAPRVQRYPIVYRVAPDRESAHALARLLSDAKNYPMPANPDDRHTCMFQPGVAVRFSRGQSRVEAIFCFRCCEVVISPAGGGYFCGRKDEFARVMRRIFPAEKSFDLPLRGDI